VNKLSKVEKEYTQDTALKIYQYGYGKDIYKDLTEDDVSNRTKKFSQYMVRFVKKFPEYTVLLQEMVEQNEQAIEAFLLDTENAKELLDIILDESCDINHDPPIEEAVPYKVFIRECFDFFLSLYRKLIPSATSTATSAKT
jgi:hypothetical protein